MKQRPPYILSGNPFLIWGELAFKTGEMMLASGQVIGHTSVARVVNRGLKPIHSRAKGNAKRLAKR